MARLQSLHLLDLILSGHQIEPIELDDLLANQVEEDLFIEYKHGDELRKNDSNDTIRRYLSAFANSAGGILIIGIDAPQRIPTQVTGCSSQGKGKLDDWAARCLTPIANYFSPQPIIQVVGHSKGEILICAVQRSLGLVPITEGGNIIYYFRLHDQTLKAPDYFVADLLLGRRQQPQLEIGLFKALNFAHKPDVETGGKDLSFEIRFRIENASIAWTDQCRWGIVYWSNHAPNPTKARTGIPNQHLLSYLNIVNETFDDPKPKRLTHVYDSSSISYPFDAETHLFSLVAPLQIGDFWLSYTWKAAFYLLARNMLPMWYQIEFAIDTYVMQLIQNREELVSPNDSFSITKIWSERPIIAWEER